jgi:FKBP-type peptidyl-prolyl cis-trans isomerase SlyD
MRFEAKTSTGSLSVAVKELTDEEVTVDGNHALAGKDLTFDVRIVDVRESTKEEINDCCTDNGCTAKNESA